MERAGIFAVAEGIEERAGDGGNIVIETNQLRLSDKAVIATATQGSGKAGNVTIRATTLTLLDEAGIFTSAEGREEGAGDGGNIVIEADQIRLLNGARISSETLGPGHGGTITVTATDTVTISGSESAFRSTATGSGDGGRIIIEAGTIQLRDHTEINTTSEQSGDAGDVTLIARDRILSDQGSVNASATAADGGIITLRAQNMVRLNSSKLAARVGGDAETTGGSLQIEADFIVASDSRIVADAKEGRGGNINLSARRVVLLDPLTVVDASSEVGIDGSVDIEAPVTNLSGVVTPLSSRFDTESSLLSNRCAERAQGKGVSRFVQGGRDQVPIEPGGVLPSPAYVASHSWPGLEPRMSSHGQPQDQNPRRGLRLAGLAPVPSGLACERWQTSQAQKQ